jgi:hypothetical protein
MNCPLLSTDAFGQAERVAPDFTSGHARPQGMVPDVGGKRPDFTSGEEYSTM